MLNVKTWLPEFPGFYGTIFEPDMSNFIEYHNQEENYKIDYECINFKNAPYEYEIAKQFTSYLESELKQFVYSIYFECVSSPKEYNFETDSIHCTIAPKIQNIKQYLKTNIDEFSQYLKDTYTGCSGFIPFYSNEISEWIDLDTFDIQESIESEHKLGSILDFICINEGITYNEIYDRIECYVDNYIDILKPAIPEIPVAVNDTAHL